MKPRNLVNVHASSQKSENLQFDQILLSKAYKDLEKKIQKSYVSWHWKVMQSLNKNWLLVPKMTWGIWWIFTQPFKSQKISLQYTIFVQSMRFELKKYRGIIFHDTEQWCKIWINPELVISKMAWGIGWTFIRTLKVWKIVNWWALIVKSMYVSARKFQRNYVSWHWRVMQNLKGNWLKAWKKT